MKLKSYKLFIESIKSDMWGIIPESVKELSDIFEKNSKKLYVVGGAVRDFLIGDKPKDFDLATDAIPDEIIEILESNGYEYNVVGKMFGVVIVYTEDQPEGMEIATFREDIYGDKLGKTRNPDVDFTTIERDVKRRDITINGLFYDLVKREIVDLVGGVADIERGIISMIGDPEMRIKEDPLRMLRAARMACKKNMKGIDEKTKKSIIKNSELINSITRERIWDEIKKAYSKLENFPKYLQYLVDLNLIEHIFYDSKINTDFLNSQDFLIVLSGIFRDENTNNLIRKLVDNYKIEYKIANKIVFLINLLKLSPNNVSDLYQIRKKSLVEDETIIEWFKAMGITDRNITKFIDYKPSTNAESLTKSGFRGRELGDEIRRIEKEKFEKLK
jgi:tRNA nucleotidyltransferase/poly(A) polymerase